MKNISNVVLVFVILALVYINVHFFPEFWSEQFAPVIAYVSDFFSFVKMLTSLVLVVYMVVLLLHSFEKIRPVTRGFMKAVCWVIALIFPALAQLMYWPFESEEEKKKKEEDAKKKEAEAKKKAKEAEKKAEEERRRQDVEDMRKAAKEMADAARLFNQKNRTTSNNAP